MYVCVLRVTITTHHPLNITHNVTQHHHHYLPPPYHHFTSPPITHTISHTLHHYHQPSSSSPTITFTSKHHLHHHPSPTYHASLSSEQDKAPWINTVGGNAVKCYLVHQGSEVTCSLLGLLQRCFFL